MRHAAGDLAGHRRGGGQRHLVFRHALGDRLDAGGAADVGHRRADLDQLDFLGGLDHAHAHGGRRYVEELDTF
ncbi:hypothetical protein D3C84_866650 [compost metagenome]